ncbi:MAG: hypothetical protein J0L98_10760 [Zoogloea sp.]|nr:hypothetical protein [Zoogloea sp.]
MLAGRGGRGIKQWFPKYCRQPRFTTAYPQIDLELSRSNRVIDFVDEGFDMAIRLGEPRDSHLITHRLEDVSVGILATPDYLARHGTSRNLTDLTVHDCLKFILTHQRPPDALDPPRYPQTGLGDDRTQPLPHPRRCAGLHQLGLRLRRAIPDRPFHRRATRRPRRSG